MGEQAGGGRVGGWPMWSGLKKTIHLSTCTFYCSAWPCICFLPYKNVSKFYWMILFPWYAAEFVTVFCRLHPPLLCPCTYIFLTCFGICRSRKWADMCKLETMPSQSFIYLQLYELKDDFIQAEIRKPSYQSVCSVSTKTIASSSRFYFNLFFPECKKHC